MPTPPASRRIMLVRHGRAHRPPVVRLSRAEVLDWLDAYDRNDLLEGETPPPATVRLAREAGLLVCSDLPRAIASAALLAAPGVTPIVSPLLHETPMPVPGAGGARLSLRTWSLLVGLGALGRLVRRAPVPAAIAAQAAEAAAWLDGLTASHGSVVAVTHVNVRSHIARALERRGWTRGPRDARFAYWGAWTYERAP